MLRFPKDFVWGVSTSAYQIEGSVGVGGRGPSIWDTFSHTSGKVKGGDTGDIAGDHYRLALEDVALMAELGLGAYRFSISWPRLFPSGRGRLNREGRDFYDRLIDALLEVGIEPWICLYHWDLPQGLQDLGGWPQRDTALYFADYAAAVAESYRDRVGRFFMLNEPNVAAIFGHLTGVHAPGVTAPGAYAAAVHHLNLATGMALEWLRSLGSWQLGTVLNLQPIEPLDGDDERDLAAAGLYHAMWNRSGLDPLLRGRYPELLEPLLEPYLVSGDLEQIHQPIDLLGLNHYTRLWVQADPNSPLGVRVAPPPGGEVTGMGWEVYPAGLYQQLMELNRLYGDLPVVVSENGAAYPDAVGAGGRVVDADRIRYLRRYLAAVHQAIDEGAKVVGYFLWSLLDNFEWAEGYSQRFGIVRVDYDTQERTPKTSFDWYRDVIRESGFEPGEG